jgi:hypothetical protein
VTARPLRTSALPHVCSPHLHLEAPNSPRTPLDQLTVVMRCHNFEFVEQPSPEVLMGRAILRRLLPVLLRKTSSLLKGARAESGVDPGRMGEPRHTPRDSSKNAPEAARPHAPKIELDQIYIGSGRRRAVSGRCVSQIDPKMTGALSVTGLVSNGVALIPFITNPPKGHEPTECPSKNVKCYACNEWGKLYCELQPCRY